MTKALRLWLCLAFCHGLLPACSPPAHNDPPPQLGGVGPEVYKLAAQSVVLIEAGLHQGSGFFIGDTGAILTAAHVIRDAALIDVTLVDESSPRHASLVGFDERQDLALLQLDVAPGETFNGLQWPTSPQPPRKGEELWSIGHPGGQRWGIASGIVAFTDGDVLQSSLAAGRGSSGGPVLAYRGPGQVELLGLISRASKEPGGPSLIVPTPTIMAALPTLQAGKRQGWSDAKGFVETIQNRSPLVHQLLLARRVELEAPDHIGPMYDTLVVPSFPAIETLELRTTWRYFFPGSHTFRYRVGRLLADGQMELLHEGPVRTFELADDRASYVHKVEIDVDFPEPGEYLVTVETDSGLSSVLPVLMVEQGGTWAGEALGFPFQTRPLHHVLVLASHIGEEVTAPAQPTFDTRDGSVEEAVAAAAATAKIGASDGAETGKSALAGATEAHVTVVGTFNTIRLPSYPARVQFDSWTRWSYLFAGDHTFRLELVDASGEVVAKTESLTFSLADERSVHQHISRWDVEFESPGLYFVLCYTDGSITRAMPIWVDEGS